MRTLAEIVPLRTAACREAVDAVSLIAAGEGGVDPAAGAHVAICLRCQAEVAAYRRVLRTMRAMRFEVIDPPEGTLGGLRHAFDAFDTDFGPSPLAGGWAVRAAACVGGLTAASAAGVLVWYGRRRLSLPPTG